MKEIYEHQPRQRQLSDCERKEVQDLLQLKVNKKLLQQHLSEKTGKIVTLKDISNIQTSLRLNAKDNSLQDLVNHLSSMEGMPH